MRYVVLVLAVGIYVLWGFHSVKDIKENGFISCEEASTAAFIGINAIALIVAFGFFCYVFW